MASKIRFHDHPPKAAGSSIYDAKQICFRRIEDCVALKNATFAAHAQALEQMLELWAKHSGVDARKGMSLDDRLKDHPDLKTTLIGLLELIEQKTTQALSSPDLDDHDDPENLTATMSKEDYDVDPEEFLIKQKWRSYSGNTWETVGAAVDMLIELTAMIRKSTVRNSSLPTHFHRPDDGFAEYAKILARNWFKDARRSLTDQLGNSVFVRRRQMLYKMKHEEKISHPAANPAPASAEPIAPLQGAIERIQGTERPQQTTPRIKLSRPAVPIFADVTPSSTNLSQLDKAKFAQRGRRIEALSGITEGSVSIEETEFSYMYPDPPTLGARQRYGACPYCSELLSASKLNKGAWRKHLHKDLQPYVCISEKCQDPVQFFTNSKQWLQHMAEFHDEDWPQKVHMATWYCDRGHERKEFKSETDMREHLVHDHKSLSEAHVSALIRRNWGLGRREAFVCPLCESTPSNIVPLMNDKDKASLLSRHIGDHLKALALFSLPSLNTDPAGDEQNSSSGAQLPTNDDSNADPDKKKQELAQFDGDLEGSLTFDDDPCSSVGVIGSEATINKEHAPGAPSDLDAALEWKFASSEQEDPELDPILENLRIGSTGNHQATTAEKRSKKVRLVGQIRSALVESVFDWGKPKFCPDGIIDSLVTKESITSELRSDSSSRTQQGEEVGDLVEFISVSAKKLFAITVLTKQYKPPDQLLQQRMEVFRDKGITDLNLPLQESWWEENCWHGVSRGRRGPFNQFNDAFGDSSEKGRLWGWDDVKKFCLIQQGFLAPVFSSTEPRYDFEPDAILPFIEKDPSQDGYTPIRRYRIHERHIDQQVMDAGPPYYVAVKEPHPYSWEMSVAWENKIDMLSRLNALNHDHIVRFLAAFRRGREDYFMMFEWANGRNLKHLWRTFHRPELTSGLVKATFRLLVGLTSAMGSIHDASLSLHSPNGHLTPKNILWFKSDNDNDLGTLKIGYWESEERVETQTDLMVDELDFKNRKRVPRYAAPGSRSARISSRTLSMSDIWSLGCIMLEFLIWLMYGVDGLDRFGQESRQGTFFDDGTCEDQYGRPVVTVGTVVLKWMDHMAADPACEVRTTALGNLLELIRTRLLMVKIPRQPELDTGTTTLQVSTELHSSVGGQADQARERCTPSELEERMREILEENETEEYWLAAQPQPPPGI